MFQFLRLTTKFWAVLRLTDNPIETLLKVLKDMIFNGLLLCCCAANEVSGAAVHNPERRKKSGIAFFPQSFASNAEGATVS